MSNTQSDATELSGRAAFRWSGTCSISHNGMYWVYAGQRQFELYEHEIDTIVAQIEHPEITETDRSLLAKRSGDMWTVYSQDIESSENDGAVLTFTDAFAREFATTWRRQRESEDAASFAVDDLPSCSPTDGVTLAWAKDGF